MQVQVDNRQITQMEEALENYLQLFLALTVKYGDGKGILRVSPADMNKSDKYSLSIKNLAKGVRFQAKKKED